MAYHKQLGTDIGEDNWCVRNVAQSMGHNPIITSLGYFTYVKFSLTFWL